MSFLVTFYEQVYQEEQTLFQSKTNTHSFLLLQHGLNSGYKGNKA